VTTAKLGHCHRPNGRVNIVSVKASYCYFVSRSAERHIAPSEKGFATIIVVDVSSLDPRP
jgi:hypothetical protein